MEIQFTWLPIEPHGGTWTGQLWHGLNGALLYFRDLDGGVNWDIDTKDPTRNGHFKFPWI